MISVRKLLLVLAGAGAAAVALAGPASAESTQPIPPRVAAAPHSAFQPCPIPACSRDVLAVPFEGDPPTKNVGARPVPAGEPTPVPMSDPIPIPALADTPQPIPA